LCIVEDITERKQHEIKLKYLSEHDPLTEIYNRNHFGEILGRDIAEHTSGEKALLLMTLNDFSEVNVTHGYVYGEGLLKHVARKLAELSTPYRQLFQIASDRFIFYVRQYESKEDLQNLCRTVIEVLDESLNEIRVYGTVGVLELESIQTSVDDILKLASIAAEYAAVNHAERYSFFDRNMEASVNRKELIKSELLKCVKNEGDTTLYMVYQPIFHAETGAIYGFEALARFTGDRTGQVPPNEFIPIAEEAQLIVPLGKRIIRLACAFLKRLETSGIHDKVIAVNISAIQLHRDDFLPDLLDAVAETGVNARNITLEITESVFSDSYQKINEKLGTIREKGIDISIDDFGTGYSSLAREIELNVSCLKLDKQFIDGLIAPDTDALIVGDVISMAHKLGHSVVAEGVELEEQRQYLVKHHCDYIQGYLLSRPLPEEKAFQLFE
jgi:diguanylate cyclase (GGDEF)-like protein